MTARRDYYFRARFTSFHAHASLLTFFSLFHSHFSNARVFGKTLVHEFPISYSYTECYLLFLAKHGRNCRRVACQKLTIIIFVFLKSNISVNIRNIRYVIILQLSASGTVELDEHLIFILFPLIEFYWYTHFSFYILNFVWTFKWMIFNNLVIIVSKCCFYLGSMVM